MTSRTDKPVNPEFDLETYQTRLNDLYEQWLIAVGQTVEPRDEDRAKKTEAEFVNAMVDALIESGNHKLVLRDSYTKAVMNGEKIRIPGPPLSRESHLVSFSMLRRDHHMRMVAAELARRLRESQPSTTERTAQELVEVSRGVEQRREGTDA